jgi:hypothetical protein
MWGTWRRRDDVAMAEALAEARWDDGDDEV